MATRSGSPCRRPSWATSANVAARVLRGTVQLVQTDGDQQEATFGIRLVTQLLDHVSGPGEPGAGAYAFAPEQQLEPEPGGPSRGSSQIVVVEPGAEAVGGVLVGVAVAPDQVGGDRQPVEVGGSQAPGPMGLRQTLVRLGPHPSVVGCAATLEQVLPAVRC